MRPPIVLLTDFGHQDWFVGTVKGVMYGLAPDVTLIDLCHDIPPGDIRSAAFTLFFSYRYFPHGTVFCCVVDPGVGTARESMVATDGTYFFTAPNNGLLGLVAENNLHSWQSYEIRNESYMLPNPSQTFHGRDVFAPAAAHLARGDSPTEFGPQIQHFVPMTFPQTQHVRHQIVGEVIYIDRFGNLITNISEEHDLSGMNVRKLELTLLQLNIKGIKKTFADARQGEPLMYIGSCGFVEIGINGGNAAKELGIVPGEKVILRMVIDE